MRCGTSINDIPSECRKTKSQSNQNDPSEYRKMRITFNQKHEVSDSE